MTRFVIDVSKSARHTCRKIHAYTTEHDHAATRHIFATVVAHAFRNKEHAGVADTEAFTGKTVDENLARSSAVTDNVTGNDVFFGLEACIAWRTHDNLTTRKALAHKVVRFAFEVKRNTRSEERTEALPRDTLQVNLDRVFGEALHAKVFIDFARKFRTHRAVGIVNNSAKFHRSALIKRILHERQEFATVEVDKFFLDVLLVVRLHAAIDCFENLREVKIASLVERNRLVAFEQVAAATSFFERMEAKACKDFTDFVCNKVEEVFDVFRLACKTLAEFSILRCNTHRALVRMALAVHHAAKAYEQVCRKSKFFGTEESCHHNVTARLELTIDLELDAATQVIEHKCLFRFGNTKFPREAGMLDRSKRRSTRTTIVARNEHYIGMSFRDTRGNRTHAHFGHKLHRDTGLRVRITQIVNELGQVFDRVNIMMRRRRNQRNIRNRVTDTRHELVHLVSRQLATFTRLCTLRHLDLQILCMAEIVNRYAKAARSNLTDCRATDIAVCRRSIAVWVFTTFTAVAHGSDAVHGNSNRFVGFRAQGAKAHGTSDKVMDNRFAAFDFGNIDRSRLLKLEESAQSSLTFRLVVDELAIDLELFIIAPLHRLTECRQGLRSPQVLFAFFAECVLATRLEHLASIGKCNLLAIANFAGNFFEADTFDAACGTRQELLDKFVVQAHRFENLGTAVAAERRNTHLRHDLQKTLIDSLYIICSSRHRIHIQVAVMAHVGNALESKIRVDDRRTETEEQRKVHHFANFTGLHNQTDFRTDTRFNKSTVYTCCCKERRYRHIAPVNVLVRKHDDIKVIVHRTHGIAREVLQSGFQHFAVTTERELHLEHFRLESLVTDILETTDFVFGHNRARNLDEVSLFRRFFEDVAVVADVSCQAHHEFFTDRVNRRVRHLGEQLLEIVEQRLRLVRKHGQCGIVTHRTNRFCTGLCHRLQNHGQVFGRITETFLLHQDIIRNIRRIDFAKEATNAHLVFRDPTAVRLAAGHLSLHFGVFQNTVIFEVEVNDFTRFEAALFFNFVIAEVKHSRFRSHHEETIFT